MSAYREYGRIEQLDLQVDRIIATLDRELSQASWQSGNDYPLLDDAPLLGIVGERGSGKTTLLLHLCDRLRREEQYVVLPPIRPESMFASQSLLVSMLAELARITSEFMTYSRSGSNELVADSQRALRSALLATTSSVDGLFDNSGSLGQFATDSASVLQRVTELPRDIHTYIRNFLSVSGFKGIVFPVDDIDLAPGRLSRLMSDVRMVAQCPGVVPIVCLSWSDIRANLRAETAQSFNSLPKIELDRLVDQQVMKTFRPDRVFEPLQLPRDERLAFAPMGKQLSLGDLLTTVFRGLDRGSQSNLGDWLADHASGKGSTLAFGWLPDTYRGLQHLYFEAEGLLEAIREDRHGLELGHHLRSVVASISRDYPEVAVQLEIQSLASSRGSGPKLVAAADWRRCLLFVNTNSNWERVFYGAGTGTRVMLRKVSKAKGSLFADRLKSDSNLEDRRDMPDREVSVALMAQSILSLGVFEFPRPSGPLSLVDSSCEFLQSITIHGLPTDDKLLLLPGSAGIIYVDRWLQAWNWIVKNSLPQASGGTAPLEVAISQLCRAVTRIWYGGQTPDEVVAATNLIEAVVECADLYVELSARVSLEAHWDADPQRAFCEWFEFLLPHSFHEAVLPQEQLQDCLEIWQAAMASSSSSGGAAFDRLRRFFEPLLDGQENVRQRREKLWLFGYRPLLRSVSPELALNLNEFEKEYEERGGKGSRGRDVVESLVIMSENRGKYRFAPKITMQGQAQESAVRRVLDQLRQT